MYRRHGELTFVGRGKHGSHVRVAFDTNMGSKTYVEMPVSDDFASSLTPGQEILVTLGGRVEKDATVVE